jgi:putative sterol carrier protein
MSDLLTLLQDRFEPTRAGELDATLEFDWQSGTCRVSVHDGKATFHHDANTAPEPELVLYFGDEATALAIISGRQSPIEAFMKGDFRSNGYLVWAFQTLSAFSKSSS